MEQSAAEKKEIGVHGAEVRSLERVAVRLRESGATQSAWRMSIGSDQGGGTITLFESAAGPIYRGEGVFLGWSQEQLATVYQTLNVPADEPEFELPQLG